MNRAKAHRSALEMVSTLPNRKLLSSGTYPGVRNTNRMPTAMPIAQMTAMAESSRTRPLTDISSTPSDEATANSAAVSTGFHPR